MQLIFEISIAVILYTYLGYPLLLWIGIGIRKIFGTTKRSIDHPFKPSVTVVVAAYNEAICIEEKIINTLSLQYPSELVQYIFVTDGSVDETPQIVSRYPAIQLMHQVKREGKIAAINRAMKEVVTGIVVFTDANTLLNREALHYITQHYSDESIGAVAGEKRVAIPANANATAGEGMYWKYESLIKQYESTLHTVVGAAGELFSIRTKLYAPVAADTILDDLMISMQIAFSGHRICYEKRAVATEQPSRSIKEENKRKIRIAAGDIQAMTRIPFFKLLFTQPLLWFEYASHRVFRWVVVPYLLILVAALNIALVNSASSTPLIRLLLYVQFGFYGISLLGFMLRNTPIRPRFFFAPYYFCLMHYNLIAGTLRYLRGEQEVGWEKVERE